MVRFTTFLALVVGSMEIIQLESAAARGLVARIDLRPVNIDAFQRRQTSGSIPQVPPQCVSICNPINGILASGICPPSQCCLASFETSYFNCFVCVAATLNQTDYSEPQSIIDTLYDECARIGFQLPVLTFPGQNTTRALSSVVQLPSSQTTVSVITSLHTPSIVQTTISTLTSPTATATSPQATGTTNTPKSSGSRSVETSRFNLIASAMMLGIWLYFVV